jgi:hypothetical protein
MANGKSKFGSEAVPRYQRHSINTLWAPYMREMDCEWAAWTWN